MSMLRQQLSWLLEALGISWHFLILCDGFCRTVLLPETSQTPSRRASFAPVHESDNSGVTSKTTPQKKPHMQMVLPLWYPLWSSSRGGRSRFHAAGYFWKCSLCHDLTIKERQKKLVYLRWKNVVAFSRSLFISELEVSKEASSVHFFQLSLPREGLHS